MSVGASAMQASAQRKFVNAQNDANNKAYAISKKAREDELARQAGYEKEAASYWDRATTELAPATADADRAAATSEFMKNFDEMPTTQPEGQFLSGQEFANDTIKTEIASRANTAAADARRRVQALAKLTSYGATDLKRSTSLGGSADLLQTLNGIRRGSLGASAGEQNIAPAQVTQGKSTFADILSGAGGIVSSMGGKTKQPASTY